MLPPLAFQALQSNMEPAPPSSRKNGNISCPFGMTSLNEGPTRPWHIITSKALRFQKSAPPFQAGERFISASTKPTGASQPRLYLHHLLRKGITIEFLTISRTLPISSWQSPQFPHSLKGSTSTRAKTRRESKTHTSTLVSRPGPRLH